MFLSDDGVHARNVRLRFRISAVYQPNLCFNVHLNTAYAAHYVYLNITNHRYQGVRHKSMKARHTNVYHKFFIKC